MEGIMRTLCNTFLILLSFQLCNLNATTYLKFWVNGQNANTVTQGDMFAWEFDVAAPGNRADVQLWIDFDKSRDVSTGDFLLETFTMTDGEIENDGPADSSAVPDGVVYVRLGRFGFAVQSYLMIVTDADESTANNWFEMQEMVSPPATVSGKIFIEGVTPPDPLYANLMIGAMGEEGIFSGLSNNNGDYSINIPEADKVWQIGPLFEQILPGYLLQERGYEQIIPAGNTDSLNFYFTIPKAYVYGDLIDQDLQLIDLNGYIGIENQTTDQESVGEVIEGHFVIPAPVTVFGQDSTNTFQFRIQEEVYFPTYLGPSYTNEFEIKYGDSTKVDLKLYATNTVIYGYVTEDGQLPSKAYQIYANSDSIGYMESFSDGGSGYFEIPVRDGSWYSVGLQDDPEWGTPPPDGLVLEENWFYVQPGDTVHFNFTPTVGRITGAFSFDPNDDQPFDYKQSSISAWDSNYTRRFDGKIHEDNTFEISVPSGKYNLVFYAEDNNFLALPSEYFDVVVAEDTVSGLNFELNYGHAQLVVKLIDPPLPSETGYWINTTGEWPDVYGAWQDDLMPDTSYVFNVCEGDWYLGLPIGVDYQLYDVFPEDTIVTVTEQDSIYYVEFVYLLKAGLAAHTQIPETFSLYQNYPNPFNPLTLIRWQLPVASYVDVSVYNMLGQRVATLVNENQTAGQHQIKWNASGLASGVYYYRIKAGDFMQTKKMVLIQ
jgi:hypothetical protein